MEAPNNNPPIIRGIIWSRVRDLQIITTELALSDLTVLDKIKSRLSRTLKADRSIQKELDFIDKIGNILEKQTGNILSYSPTDQDERRFLRSYNLLSFKKAMIVLNIDENV